MLAETDARCGGCGLCGGCGGGDGCAAGAVGVAGSGGGGRCERRWQGCRSRHRLPAGRRWAPWRMGNGVPLPPLSRCMRTWQPHTCVPGSGGSIQRVPHYTHMQFSSVRRARGRGASVGARWLIAATATARQLPRLLLTAAGSLALLRLGLSLGLALGLGSGSGSGSRVGVGVRVRVRVTLRPRLRRPRQSSPGPKPKPDPIPDLRRQSSSSPPSSAVLYPSSSEEDGCVSVCSVRGLPTAPPPGRTAKAP